MSGEMNGRRAVDPLLAQAEMKSKLTLAIRYLESVFPGANVTVLVSMPGCGRLVGKFPPFSHATSADEIDLAAVASAFAGECKR
jgi:hypothetical protein